MLLYKLTDQDCETQNNTKWIVGKKNRIKKSDRHAALCSSGILHAYRNQNLALMLNPIHANIADPKLFEVEGEMAIEDWGKCGAYELTAIRELAMPEWYGSDKRNDVLIQFAILCAEAVVKYATGPEAQKAIDAAKKYLKEKTAYAARAADAAAYAAARAAYAADAARAAYAADAAAYAARAARAAYAADAAAYAAYAADAADAEKIDFCELADKAVEMITRKE